MYNVLTKQDNPPHCLLSAVFHHKNMFYFNQQHDFQDHPDQYYDDWGDHHPPMDRRGPPMKDGRDRDYYPPPRDRGRPRRPPPLMEGPHRPELPEEDEPAMGMVFSQIVEYFAQTE